MNTILDLIKETIKKCDDLELSIDVEQIQIYHEFRSDLGVDSLGLMALAFELKDFYPSIDEMAIAEWVLVEDCINYLKSL